MAQVVLFHHAQGLTSGVQAFADQLRAAGHSVTLPDLYEGKTFSDLDEGVGYAREVGFGTLDERANAAIEGLPTEVVYAGFSLGSAAAQRLTQTRPGALGCLLYHAGDIPVSEFGSWPDGVPAQVHVAEQDEWVPLNDAQDFVGSVPDAELFVYPGSAHLFTDSSLPVYDAEATELVLERSLALLSRWS
jgi:dienelactone hydrolase